VATLDDDAARAAVPAVGHSHGRLRLLRETGSRVTLSWLDPEVPSWFTGTFDRRTALPQALHMTAAAHFMRHRYVAFNRATMIEPPRRR
jgi:hypothetical protein